MDIDLFFKIFLYGLAIFAIIKLLQAVGLFSTASDRQDEADAGRLQDMLSKKLTDTEVFNIMVQAQKDCKKKTGKTCPTSTEDPYFFYGLTLTPANAVAKEIYDSKGVFNDDEDVLYGAIRKIPSFADIIRVSKILADKFTGGRDLLSYLEGFTGDEEQGKIYRMLKPLPLYNKQRKLTAKK